MPTESQSNTDASNASGSGDLQTVPYAEFKRLQDQYNGQQGYITQLKKQTEAADVRVAEITRDYEARLATLTGERDAATSNMTQYQQQLNQATSKLSKFEARQSVGGLISEKYPGLMEAHMKGLLEVEGKEGEVLENYLNGWNSLVAERADRAARETLLGSTPPAPTGAMKVGLTAAQLQEKLFTLDPSDKEYAAVEAEYIAALQKP